MSAEGILSMKSSVCCVRKAGLYSEAQLVEALISLPSAAAPECCGFPASMVRELQFLIEAGLMLQIKLVSYMWKPGSYLAKRLNGRD